MSLTTFRKSGAPVPTPVWFAEVGQVLYVMTQQDSGKVKRIRTNAQVEVAPCDMRGTILGASAEAMARILPPEEFARANAALRQKYGFQQSLFRMFSRLRGGQLIYLEVMPM